MPHKEAKLRLPTPPTSVVESASEAENYGGTRPKTTQRVPPMSPQVEAVPASKTRQDWEIEMHAALLRDEVYNIAPGTVNVTQGDAQARKVDLKEADEIYNSQRLPQVPDMPVAGGDMPSVTFKEPVSSTLHVRLHPSTIGLSGVSSPETSDRETEDVLIRHYKP